VPESFKDGVYSFLYNHGMRYTGRYRDGLRDGLWQVDNPDGSAAWEVTWQTGEWHGPAKTWWKNGVVEHAGQHRHGKRDGEWSFWFSNGQLAARGTYADDRKIGEWQYFDERGASMDYENWAREFEHWDWAYDDYTGFPRGENWPSPPTDSQPSE
jgi:antitoxin component YwqK of YwqJK toxin-antitoxin module